jgi:hypothetical protein
MASDIGIRDKMLAWQQAAKLAQLNDRMTSDAQDFERDTRAVLWEYSGVGRDRMSELIELFNREINLQLQKRAAMAQIAKDYVDAAHAADAAAAAKLGNLATP